MRHLMLFVSPPPIGPTSPFEGDAEPSTTVELPARSGRGMDALLALSAGLGGDLPPSPRSWSPRRRDESVERRPGARERAEAKRARRAAR